MSVNICITVEWDASKGTPPKNPEEYAEFVGTLLAMREAEKKFGRLVPHSFNPDSPYVDFHIYAQREEAVFMFNLCPEMAKQKAVCESEEEVAAMKEAGYECYLEEYDEDALREEREVLEQVAIARSDEGGVRMSTTTEIDYEIVRFMTEDAEYAIVLWELPDGECVMEVWDVAANMKIDPYATTFKKVSTTGGRMKCANRDKALALAGLLISERDTER